jgi:hypothetical protein
MSKFFSDIDTIKKLAVLSVSLQDFIQKRLDVGSKFFNYEGEATSEYENLKSSFENNLNSLILELQGIQKCIAERKTIED